MIMDQQSPPNIDLLTLSSDESDDEESQQRGQNKNYVKRMAIIDACNVMHACAGSSYSYQQQQCFMYGFRPPPDALGLYMMVNQLLQESFDVRAFVPVSYISGKREVTNRYALELLQKLRYVTVIEDGSHDDLIILEMAKCVGGFVISNDKFRDHLHEVHSLKDLIQNRVVRFKFRPTPIESVQGGKAALAEPSNKYFNGMEFVLLPPKFSSMFVVDDSDPSFGMAFCQRMHRSHKRTVESLAYLEVMADYCQQEICQIYSIKPPTLDYFDPNEKRLPMTFDKFLDYWRRNKKQKDACAAASASQS